MSSIRRPWYPWYPKDFVVDEKVQSLSPIAELVYRRALDVMWQANDCQLPNVCQKLANQLGKGLPMQEFENAWSEIQHEGFELFKTTECGKWIYSKRLKQEAEKIENLSKKRSELGKKGAKAKAKANTKQLPKQRLKPGLSDTDTDTDTDNNKNNIVETKVSPSICPYQKIVDLYHSVLSDLPRVRTLTPARQTQIKARWLKKYTLKDGTRSNTLEFWEKFFHYISESEFLMGQVEPKNGHKRFRADLEWITKEANFTKIYEGKYHG